MGPVDDPALSITEFLSLSSFWVVQLAELKAEKEWWQAVGPWEVGAVLREHGAEVNQPVAQSETGIASLAGLTTA